MEEKIVISWAKIEELAKEFRVGVAYVQDVLNSPEPNDKEVNFALQKKYGDNIIALAEANLHYQLKKERNKAIRNKALSL